MVYLEQPVTWSRRGGYECSSKGDRRFSAFNAVLADGRTIEQHYQCDVKGYQPGGTDWRLGKGKPPLDLSKDTWAEYRELWRQWALDNSHLMIELSHHVRASGYMVSDCFARTPINQARALAELLNELNGPPTGANTCVVKGRFDGGRFGSHYGPSYEKVWDMTAKVEREYHNTWVAPEEKP